MRVGVYEPGNHRPAFAVKSRQRGQALRKSLGRAGPSDLAFADGDGCVGHEACDPREPRIVGGEHADVVQDHVPGRGCAFTNEFVREADTVCTDGSPTRS